MLVIIQHKPEVARFRRGKSNLCVCAKRIGLILIEAKFRRLLILKAVEGRSFQYYCPVVHTSQNAGVIWRARQEGCHLE